jgi:hypothetical protein
MDHGSAHLRIPADAVHAASRRRRLIYRGLHLTVVAAEAYHLVLNSYPNERGYIDLPVTAT